MGIFTCQVRQEKDQALRCLSARHRIAQIKGFGQEADGVHILITGKLVGQLDPLASGQSCEKAAPCEEQQRQH